MSGTNAQLLRAALSALHYAYLDQVASRFMKNEGVIFTLHHVAPDTGRDFEPNSILRVRPEFLESVIDAVLAEGFEIISLDEIPDRLKNAAADKPSRPFACFTFDDGYKDNRDYAFPIFKRYGLPMAVYVPEQFADGEGFLWWLVLEQVVARADDVVVQMRGEKKSFGTKSVEAKYTAYNEIYWWLREIPEDRARAVVKDLAETSGLDTSNLCRDLVMNWNELREFASDPLVTIGAHTQGHYSLAKLPLERAKSEIVGSVKAIERELGRPCHHFSYPYGSATDAGVREFNLANELGLKTAVTTRKSLLQRHHNKRLTALPRLSLNGDFQDVSFVKTLLTGVPFALLNAAQAVTGRRRAS